MLNRKEKEYHKPKTKHNDANSRVPLQVAFSRHGVHCASTMYEPKIYIKIVSFHIKNKNSQ